MNGAHKSALSNSTAMRPVLSALNSEGKKISTIFSPTGKDADAGVVYAMKRISIPPLREGDRVEHTINRLKLMTEFRHKNLVAYRWFFKADKYIYLFTDVEGPSLDSVGQIVDESLLSIYIRGILDGLRYLHTQCVFHGNLQRANVFIPNGKAIKLADYGLPPNIRAQSSRDETPASLLAPEVVAGGTPSSKSDIWSVGCIAVELLTGERLLGPTVFTPDQCSWSMVEFLMQCFKPEPRPRKSADSLLRHFWISPKKCRIYERVHFFLRDEAEMQDPNSDIIGEMDQLAQMSRQAKDPVTGLLTSHRCRLQLLNISSKIGLSNDRRLRRFLREDERELLNLTKLVVESDHYKKMVLRFRDEDAHTFVDLLSHMLNLISVDTERGKALHLKTWRLLVRLSRACNGLPSTLFIKNVQRHDKDPVFGGSHGDIYRGAFAGQKIVLKRIRASFNDSKQRETRQKLCQEALLWQQLHHPFVLPFLGIDCDTFPSYFCLVSPWMRNGTILHHLEVNGSGNLDQQLYEIAQGLAYLHSQTVVHGDLRGANILVDDDWHARLADFGLAIHADATITKPSSQQGGSARWMAPELHDPHSFELETHRSSYASDVYAYACVCIELHTRKPPFSQCPYDVTAILKALEGERPTRPAEKEEKDMSDALWELTQACWAQNPKHRPTMIHVVKTMEWLASGYAGTETEQDIESQPSPELVGTAPMAGKGLSVPEHHHLDLMPRSPAYVKVYLEHLMHSPNSEVYPSDEEKRFENGSDERMSSESDPHLPNAQAERWRHAGGNYF